jgi:hypothetical protein
MPVKKLSVSLQPAIMAEVSKRVEYDNVSGALNRSLDRYFALLARSLAEWRSQLSDAECALILDATNGTMFADTISLGMLWAEIADAISLDGLDAKWQVDGQALVAKLQGSGMIGQAALVDASERWWRRVANGEQPPFGDLVAAGPPALRYPQNEE